MDYLCTAAQQVQCFTGATASGKTQALVNYVGDLQNNGVSPLDLIVFAASPDAANNLSKRLCKQLGSYASSITVTTPRAFALKVLSTSEAQAFTGRSGRMATPYEESFLLEDLKTSGARPQRLKEMCKFFYKSWTELYDEDPSWLVSTEERGIHAFLKTLLTCSDIFLEPEICNLAFKFLHNSCSALKEFSTKHVLVDDFQNLSRASQALTCLLATDSMTVAGDPQVHVSVFDSYPYAQGLDEFIHFNQVEPVELQACHRPDSLAKACISWRTLALSDRIQDTLENSSMSTTDSSVTISVFNTPQEEFTGAVAKVRQAINQGISTSEIFIVVPNRVWHNNIVRYLNAAGIQANCKPNVNMLAADIRNLQQCQLARCFTLLQLTANPSSNGAWRSWCGFGDYLGHSNVFADARNSSKTEGKPLSYFQTLDTLSCNEETRLSTSVLQMIPAFKTGKQAIAYLGSLRGRDLLENAASLVAEENCHEVLQDLITLCGPITNDDTAALLLARVYQRLQLPAFEENSNAVKVGFAADAIGQNFKLVIHLGFVNGFIPSYDAFDATKKTVDQRQRMHAESARTLHALAGSTSEELALSYFTHIDPENAGRLKLKINRLRLIRGQRMCLTSASEFINTL